MIRVLISLAVLFGIVIVWACCVAAGRKTPRVDWNKEDYKQ